MTRGSRTLLLVASTIAGMVIGATGGFVQAHRSVWWITDRYLVVPWGVVVVLVVLCIAIRAAATVCRLRAGGWLVLGGWLTMTLYLATETGSGDLAVSSGVRQWSYLLVGCVVGAALATLPPRTLGSLRDADHRDRLVADAAESDEATR